MHDPLIIHDLIHDELAQARETGHDVDAVERELLTLDPTDHVAHERLYESIAESPQLPGWSYEEPTALADIESTLPSDRAEERTPRDVADRIHGGWLGRVVGCNLGKPVEQGEHWTSGRIRAYLEMAGAWPLRDYFPVLDPMPAGYEFRDNWVETTRGRVNGSARDDDIDYAILGLFLLEQHGAGLRPHHVADAWLSLLPYLQVYTAERATYRNLLAGMPVEEAGRRRNPYREWIGALIRGDVFGWSNPGSPREAARLAYQDASLSHVGNGIYGEMWSAALTSSAFVAGSAREAYDRALLHVPPRSRLAEALVAVRDLRDADATWDEALAVIEDRFGHYSWVHTINNAALIAAGLLWGEDDFTTTVGLTVQGGWDTDSNGATAGSVMGVLTGAKRLPGHFVEPLHDRTRSALFGFDNSEISALAQRTLVLATRANP